MDVWTITITAPTGAFDASLTISQDGDHITGQMGGKAGSGPMLDLNMEDGAITWATKIERPMPMKLKFKGTHANGAMAGTVKFGVFASGTFQGTKAPA